MSSLVAVGAALAAVGVAGRMLMRAGLNSSIKFYKGGFESVMTKREAGLILGVSPSTTSDTIKQAHKRIMLLNHPDKGGSPYMAAKINEAKDMLESR